MYGDGIHLTIAHKREWSYGFKPDNKTVPLPCYLEQTEPDTHSQGRLSWTPTLGERRTELDTHFGRVGAEPDLNRTPTPLQRPCQSFSLSLPRLNWTQAELDTHPVAAELDTHFGSELDLRVVFKGRLNRTPTLSP